MFGGLHIEMAALRTLGDWLQGCKHLCKPRLQQQGQQTHSCEHPMSCSQEEHIKQHCTSCNTVPTSTTVWENPGVQRTFPSLKTGVAREEKTSPSFTTGQPCWN
ncbi:hypothetical protein ACOMHN_031938 [Nucella lapillus]